MPYDTSCTPSLPTASETKAALFSLLEELLPWQQSDQRVSKRGCDPPR